jgi:hypothetical protein
VVIKTRFPPKPSTSGSAVHDRLIPAVSLKASGVIVTISEATAASINLVCLAHSWSPWSSSQQFGRLVVPSWHEMQRSRQQRLAAGSRPRGACRVNLTPAGGELPFGRHDNPLDPAVALFRCRRCSRAVLQAFFVNVIPPWKLGTKSPTVLCPKQSH